MASMDRTGGGSKSNRETPPTANLWRGGGTVEAAATSGLAEDGKGTLCTMVASRVDLLEPGPGGKHTARGESRGPGVASRRAGSRGLEGPRVLHSAVRGVEGAALLRQWANDYGKKKKAQGRFAKLTGGWRAGFCKITPPLTPAYGSRSNVSDTSFHSLLSYMVST
jgi:hypothetical protein